MPFLGLDNPVAKLLFLLLFLSSCATYSLPQEDKDFNDLCRVTQDEGVKELCWHNGRYNV